MFVFARVCQIKNGVKKKHTWHEPCLQHTCIGYMTVIKFKFWLTNKNSLAVVKIVKKHQNCENKIQVSK